MACHSSRPASWPLHAAPLQIMDTPHPNQIRRAQPEAEAATEQDALELMEMILGALGERSWQSGVGRWLE